MTDTTKAPKAKKIIGGIALIGVLAVGGGLYMFFSGSEPEAVSLDAALETVTTDSTDAQSGDSDGDSSGDADGSAEDTTTDDASAGEDNGDITGVWNVDTDSGDFDYESATGSFVGFRIEEELRTIGSTTAVGRTGDITGSITIDGTVLTEASFTVDMTTITTNDSMRDDNVQDAIEGASFPTATFVMSDSVDLGPDAASSQVSTAVTGELTIHGVTQEVTLELAAQLVDDIIVVVGSTDMVFSDFGVEVPDGGPVVSVDDFGVVEFQLLFAK